MAIHTRYKQPAETYPISIDFAGQLPVGTTIQSGTCTATDEAGNSAPSVLSGSCTVSGTALQQTITAGTNGQRYDVTFRATLTPGGAILEEDLALFVREH